MERRILELFAERYRSSAQRRGGRALRLRAWPELMSEAFSSADARLSFLDAMERLERSGLVKLRWKKRRVGDELEAVDLIDAAALYARLGLPLPEDEASALAAAAEAAGEEAENRGDGTAASFFKSIAERSGGLAGKISPREIADLASYAAFDHREAERLPIRALSIRLYSDSKRLESLISAFRSVGTSLRTAGAGVSFAERFPRRSYPEAAVAGRVALVFRDGAVWSLEGRAVSLGWSAAFDLDAIRPKAEDLTQRALTVENKETFHAFVREPFGFGLVICTGGRPNRAVRTLLHLVAIAGFSVFHAGDLDPDGIAILGEVAHLCGARSLGMDRAVFDEYLPYGRSLDRSLVSRLEAVPSEVLEMPGIADLAASIRLHRKGIEQEIIDYGPLIAGLP